MRTLRDSMCAMKRSDSACCSCSTLIICFFSITQDAARRDRRWRCRCECGCPARHPSPKKSPGPSMATTASLPVVGEHRQLDAAFLDVHDRVALVALREDHLGRPILHDPFRQTGRIEKGLGVERGDGSGHLTRIRGPPVEDVCKKTHVTTPSVSVRGSAIGYTLRNADGDTVGRHEPTCTSYGMTETFP